MTSDLDFFGGRLRMPQGPGLFEILGLEKDMDCVYGDIRDLPHLQAVFQKKKPEIVLHLAAQPIVRESYENPVYTYGNRSCAGVRAQTGLCEILFECDHGQGLPQPGMGVGIPGGGGA